MDNTNRTAAVAAHRVADDAYNAICRARFDAAGKRYGVDFLNLNDDAEVRAAFDAVVKAERALARAK